MSQPRRVLGTTFTMLGTLYDGWRSDCVARRSTLMIAATAEAVAALNQRARTELIEAGTVEADGVALHDGTSAVVPQMQVPAKR